jgi:hypothetical protein
MTSALPHVRDHREEQLIKHRAHAHQDDPFAVLRAAKAMVEKAGPSNIPAAVAMAAATAAVATANATIDAPKVAALLLLAQSCNPWSWTNHLLFHTGVRRVVSTVLLVSHRHWCGHANNGEAPPLDCPHMPVEIWHHILSFVQRRDHGALALHDGSTLPATTTKAAAKAVAKAQAIADKAAAEAKVKAKRAAAKAKVKAERFAAKAKRFQARRAVEERREALTVEDSAVVLLDQEAAGSSAAGSDEGVRGRRDTPVSSDDAWTSDDTWQSDSDSE